jgi:hypothetical protein
MPLRPRITADEGSFQALDHIANWVRFADAKATILTAALGVVMTMFIANIPTVLRAAATSEGATLALGLLSVVAAGGFAFTLGWLVRAIAPRRKGDGKINRFSWPSLTLADYETLRDHNLETSAHEDAWNQTLFLSKVAADKFDACQNAVWGFAFFVLTAVICVVSAYFLNS